MNTLLGSFRKCREGTSNIAATNCHRCGGSGEEVVLASDYRALQSQVRELHRLLGKKTLETEILKEALEHAMGSKKQLRLPPSIKFPMKAVAEVIGVSRFNLIERLRDRPNKRLGRPPLPDDDLVADIKVVVAELPTYGYRRVHAILEAPSSGRWSQRAQSTNGSTACNQGVRPPARSPRWRR